MIYQVLKIECSLQKDCNHLIESNKHGFHHELVFQRLSPAAIKFH